MHADKTFIIIIKFLYSWQMQHVYNGCYSTFGYLLQLRELNLWIAHALLTVMPIYGLDPWSLRPKSTSFTLAFSSFGIQWFYYVCHRTSPESQALAPVALALMV